MTPLALCVVASIVINFTGPATVAGKTYGPRESVVMNAELNDAKTEALKS